MNTIPTVHKLHRWSDYLQQAVVGCILINKTKNEKQKFPVRKMVAQNNNDNRPDLLFKEIRIQYPLV